MVSYLSDNFTPALISLSPQNKNKKNLKIALIAALLVVMLIWICCIFVAWNRSAVTLCPNPPEKTGLTRMSADDVSKQPPAPLSLVKVTVLNGSTSRGLASDVLSQLQNLGYSGAKAINDPLYPKGNLTCNSEIRYGSKGKALASSLRLAFPCATFFQDKRQQNSVDVSLGTTFGGLATSNESKAALDALRGLASGVKEGKTTGADIAKLASEVKCTLQ